jgi:hypothetical protein
MTFKKQNWIKYGKVGKICKLELRDEDGEVIDKAKWLLHDKDSERRIFTIFKNEYGLFKYQNGKH